MDNTSLENVYGAISSYNDDTMYNIEMISDFISTFIVNWMAGLIGITTNILNMLVLSKHGMDDSTNIVLFALSVSDFTFSCSESFYRLIRIILKFDFTLGYNLSMIYLTILAHMSTCTMNVSVWLVAVISVERMLAVCFPFYASRIITQKRTKIIVIFVYVFLCFLYIPNWTMYYLSWGFDPYYNVTVIRLFTRREYLDNDWWLHIHQTNVLPACAVSAPIITILGCTSVTIARLEMASKNIGNISTSRTKRVQEMRAIKISLVICLCMAFSILIPNSCIDAYGAIKGELIPPYTISFIRSFTQFAVQFNASMNFFIYVALSSKFSKTFKKVSGCNNV